MVHRRLGKIFKFSRTAKRYKPDLFNLQTRVFFFSFFFFFLKLAIEPCFYCKTIEKNKLFLELFSFVQVTTN